MNDCVTIKLGCASLIELSSDVQIAPECFVNEKRVYRENAKTDCPICSRNFPGEHIRSQALTKNGYSLCCEKLSIHSS